MKNVKELTSRQLLNRHQQWTADRGNWDDLWEEIAELFLVQRRSGFQSEDHPGQERSFRQFDSSGSECLVRWADAVHFALANPFTRWFTIRFQDEQLNDSDAASEWLEECQEEQRSELNQSNFSDAFNECLLDLGAFGTYSMLSEAKAGDTFEEEGGWFGLNFKSEHLGSITFTEDANCRIVTTNRECEMTAEQIVQRFAPNAGDDVTDDMLGSLVGTKVARAYRHGDRDRVFPILHAIYPRHVSQMFESRNPEAEPPPTMLPFGSVWMNQQGGKVLHRGGYYESPRTVCRLRQRAGDQYGYGIGEMTLPDMRTLNLAQMLDLKDWEGDVDPALIQEGDNIQGSVDRRPGRITTVRKIAGIATWNAIGGADRGAQRHQMRYDEKREHIRAMWHYYDLHLPRREEVGQMTAYEVQKRIQRIYQLMGPQISRIISEGIQPILDRTFNMLYRAGRFPERPEGVPLGAQLKVEYIGPVARSQKLEEVESTDRFVADLLGLAGSLAQIDPQRSLEVLDLVDFDKMLKSKADVLGVPKDQIVDEDVVEQARQVRAQAAAQAQELQNAATAGGALKDTADAVGQDNIMQLVQGGE